MSANERPETPANESPALVFLCDRAATANQWAPFAGYFYSRGYPCYAWGPQDSAALPPPFSRQPLFEKQPPWSSQERRRSITTDLWSEAFSALPTRPVLVTFAGGPALLDLLLHPQPPLARAALLSPSGWQWLRLLRSSPALPLWIGLCDNWLHRRLANRTVSAGVQLHLFSGLGPRFPFEKGWERAAFAWRCWLDQAGCAGQTASRR